MVGQKAYSQAAGVFTNINALLPVNQNSQAVGINNAGDVAGFYMPTATTSLGFEDMSGHITTIDPFGSTFTQALASTMRERSLAFIPTPAACSMGFYTDAGDNVIGFVGTPTPEPASLGLLSAGMLAGVALLRRRIAVRR